MSESLSPPLGKGGGVPSYVYGEGGMKSRHPKLLAEQVVIPQRVHIYRIYLCISHYICLHVYIIFSLFLCARL